MEVVHNVVEKINSLLICLQINLEDNSKYLFLF